MFCGMGMLVKVMSCLMYVSSPPPLFCCLSVLIAVYPVICGVFEFVVSFVSWIVTMSVFVLCIRSVSSASLLLMPLMLICMILSCASFCLLLVFVVDAVGLIVCLCCVFL